MIEPSQQIHQFGDITVDAAGMRVLKGSEPVPLEPKSLKVLLYLIDNRDRLVTKEELLKSVWQDTFVTDNALTRTVAQIRKALGDDARQARIIETVPRLGYRFIAVAVPPPAKPSPGTVIASPARSYVKYWRYGMAVVVLCFAAVAFTLHHRLPTALKLSVPAQFTTSDGLDMYPTFAPDGASLAYSSDRSGTFEIYVEPLARGAPTSQVTSDGRQNVQPAWSPDGRYIAYHSVRDGGIWVVAATGGSRRKVSDFGNSPAWSPDGTRLAFQDRSFTSVSGSDQACGGAVGGIWVVDIAGGSPVQLPLPPDSAVCANVDPSWTPDGRIVFARRQRAISQICSIAPDGSGLRLVAQVPGMANAPRWLPARNSIFYGLYATDGNFTIERLPVDSNGKRTGPPEELLSRGGGVPRTPALSPDGRRLAFTATVPVSQLDSISLTPPGMEPAGPPTALITENVYRYALVFISPDGLHLALTLVRRGTEGDIWVSDIDGRNARLLSMIPNSSFCAGWLPDSSGLAYSRYSPKGGEIWSMSLRDGVERRLSSAPINGGFPMLSPDGRQVIYHTAPTSLGMTLRKLNLETGQTSDLVGGKDVRAGFGVWSPDGKEIAFLLQHGQDDQLATVSSNGGNYTEWTTGKGKTWASGWSPDGQAVIATAQRDGVWNVYAINRDRTEKKLTDYTSLREYVRYARMTPSGDRIVYEYNETKGNIYIGELRQ